jgi:hypothetical protein
MESPLYNSYFSEEKEDLNFRGENLPTQMKFPKTRAIMRRISHHEPSILRDYRTFRHCDIRNHSLRTDTDKNSDAGRSAGG